VNLPAIIANRKARQRAYRRRKTFGNTYAELYVTKRRRCVRITVKSLTSERFAHVDLDDAEIDQLIRRLRSVRGGHIGDRARRHA